MTPEPSEVRPLSSLSSSRPKKPNGLCCGRCSVTIDTTEGAARCTASTTGVRRLCWAGVSVVGWPAAGTTSAAPAGLVAPAVGAGSVGGTGAGAAAPGRLSVTDGGGSCVGRSATSEPPVPGEADATAAERADAPGACLRQPPPAASSRPSTATMGSAKQRGRGDPAPPRSEDDTEDDTEDDAVRKAGPDNEVQRRFSILKPCVMTRGLSSHQPAPPRG